MRKFIRLPVCYLILVTCVILVLVYENGLPVGTSFKMSELWNGIKVNASALAGNSVENLEGLSAGESRVMIQAPSDKEKHVDTITYKDDKLGDNVAYTWLGDSVDYRAIKLGDTVTYENGKLGDTVDYKDAKLGKTATYNNDNNDNDKKLGDATDHKVLKLTETVTYKNDALDNNTYNNDVKLDETATYSDNNFGDTVVAKLGENVTYTEDKLAVTVVPKLSETLTYIDGKVGDTVHYKGDSARNQDVKGDNATAGDDVLPSDIEVGGQTESPGEISSSSNVTLDVRTSTAAPSVSPAVYIEAMAPEFYHLEAGLDMDHPPLKKILVWTEGYGSKTMSFGYGRAPFVTAKCEVDMCMMTENRTLVSAKDFDALIFHFRSMKMKELPRLRSPHQRWVFWEIESASYVYQDPKQYDGLFNWTMTYRMDSDVPVRYGRVYPIAFSSPSSPLAAEGRNYAKEKTKMAAWFVSNCFTFSRREKIVKLLQKFIQVDVYGKCGTLVCSRDQAGECYNMLGRVYKFYLSFENSLCKDYVTEKLFSVLRYDVVPVVFGMANYTHVAPPHSFINILDFPSITSLVKYLKYLDGNDTAYNEYFRWKGHYRVDDGWSNTAQGFCDLCKKLHHDHTPKVYQDMKEWFISKGECKKLDTRSWRNWAL